MSYFTDTFGLKTESETDIACMITDGKVRVSVLTECLVRVEFSSHGEFCDEPTQSVWYRNFEKPQFKTVKSGTSLIIRTGKAEFCVSLGTGAMKYIIPSGMAKVTNYKSGNLKGTRRTLDRTSGRVKIGDGIISENGAALLDDSKSLVLKQDGKILPREHAEKDRYYFAYGRDYSAAVRDLFRLTGMPPLIPRYALGNWWSRYKAYTQQEYLSLMQRFIDEEIPVTVATVDMDWHWVDVVDKFGNDAKNRIKRKNLWENIYDKFVSQGWTGYSWNTDLFPDYKAFLSKLKAQGFHTTLNLHPSTGVRYFEDCYDEVADFMGADKSNKQQIPFDITDPKFIEAYFRFLHHPYEKQGVDFWWLDWQQGEISGIDGLDPLWALNHYHFLDSRSDNKRPLILSRFAGAGSHRYPLGFSGDTAINWQTLEFQPYFTSTASNIGYTWWSHDIGGHHYGNKDDELYMRWVQFGVFSPIMRLHSTSNEFMGKEPWKYKYEARCVATEFMRLRHRLIPYIYTQNYRTHKYGEPLVRPMYYAYPDEKEAYRCKNEYFFGDSLICAPITEHTSPLTNLAGTEVWLPEGRYTDIFTGGIYRGGRKIKMFRDMSSFPVLAAEGSIIPLDMNSRINCCAPPAELEILIYRGNGEYTLYEDDGETNNFENGIYCETKLSVTQEKGAVTFEVGEHKGVASVLPERRCYTFSFRDVANCAAVCVSINEEKTKEFTVDKTRGFVCVTIKDVLSEAVVNVTLTDITAAENKPRSELLIDLISKVQGANKPKQFKYTDFALGRSKKIPHCKKPLREAIEEIFAMTSEN
ncbi:MAG: DUF5110 domain-containing protein [Clostridiales bacterium]|nr:DUF5110 domain-containing protein [Clostridiales bacterium]